MEQITDGTQNNKTVYSKNILAAIPATILFKIPPNLCFSSNPSKLQTYDFVDLFYLPPVQDILQLYSFQGVFLQELPHSHPPGVRLRQSHFHSGRLPAWLLSCLLFAWLGGVRRVLMRRRWSGGWERGVRVVSGGWELGRVLGED